MVRMSFIQFISLVVAGQAVCYPVGHAIHVLDGKLEVGDVLPPSGLSTRQMGLSLEVLETLVVCDYDELVS